MSIRRWVYSLSEAECKEYLENRQKATTGSLADLRIRLAGYLTAVSDDEVEPFLTMAKGYIEGLIHQSLRDTNDNLGLDDDSEEEFPGFSPPVEIEEASALPQRPSNHRRTTGGRTLLNINERASIIPQTASDALHSQRNSQGGHRLSTTNRPQYTGAIRNEYPNDIQIRVESRDAEREVNQNGHVRGRSEAREMRRNDYLVNSYTRRHPAPQQRVEMNQNQRARDGNINADNLFGGFFQ